MIFGEKLSGADAFPSMAGFKTFSGHWISRASPLRMQAADGPKLIAERAACKDGRVSVELQFPDRKGQNAGLIVRARRLVLVRPSLAVMKSPSIRHGRYYDWQDIATISSLSKILSATWPVGRRIALEVKLEGSVIEIFVDGKSILRHDDGDKTLRAGGVGLRGWHCQASFRNLRVKMGTSTLPLSFKPERVPEITGMWRSVQGGTATGRFGIVKEKPFVGSQSQQVAFISGDGRVGVENRGLNRWGMNFVEGKPYEGYVWVRAEKPTTVFASLESWDGSRRYAEAKLDMASKDWQRLNFTLTPSAGDQAGRFVLALKQPGSLMLGHAFLQPGDWGRFKGLPVRRDVAEGLIDQGVTVLRYGGSMVNNDGYRWKKMIGQRDRRPPYAGTWYRYSTNGWGIADFMDFCEAAGFEYIPDFNIDETPKDMADFIEYAKGSAQSEWGRKRIADGRKQPYQLRYLEIGNEERVDEKYAAKFESIAKAIWAKDSEIVLVVGDFAYDRRIEDPFKITGAASGLTSLAGHKAAFCNWPASTTARFGLTYTCGRIGR